MAEIEPTDATPIEPETPISREEALRITGIRKLGTLNAMICRKQIPHHRLSGRTVVFYPSQLRQWMNDRFVAVEPAKTRTPAQPKRGRPRRTA